MVTGVKFNTMGAGAAAGKDAAAMAEAAAMTAAAAAAPSVGPSEKLELRWRFVVSSASSWCSSSLLVPTSSLFW
jgi:hypothetical protein